jgi:hypothetical protein
LGKVCRQSTADKVRITRATIALSCAANCGALHVYGELDAVVVTRQFFFIVFSMIANRSLYFKQTLSDAAAAMCERNFQEEAVFQHCHSAYTFGPFAKLFL